MIKFNEIPYSLWKNSKLKKHDKRIKRKQKKGQRWNDMKTIIRPLTDLSKNMTAIDGYIKHNTPVYITKGGASYMVVMSHQHFEKMQEEIAFLKRLATAEAESRRGDMVDVEDLEKDLDNILLEETTDDARTEQAPGTIGN